MADMREIVQEDTESRETLMDLWWGLLTDVQHIEVLSQVVQTCKTGDADGLLALLTSPEGMELRGSRPATMAAYHGHTSCLRVLRDCRLKFSSIAWDLAARAGHIECLAFGFSLADLPQDCTPQDTTIEIAVQEGHLACVDFLVQQGLPRSPYMRRAHHASTAAQLKCIQLMADRGVAIDPNCLTQAVLNGDLDFVRWLHQRGIPLWDRISHWSSDCECCERYVRVEPGTLNLPYGSVEDIWTALRYGSMYGAPVTCQIRQLFEEKRQQTRAVLLCFKAAARLSQGPASPQQTRAWAGMAALPPDVVGDILVLADFEIWESVMRRARLRAPTLTQ